MDNYYNTCVKCVTGTVIQNSNLCPECFLFDDLDEGLLIDDKEIISFIDIDKTIIIPLKELKRLLKICKPSLFERLKRSIS